MVNVTTGKSKLKKVNKVNLEQTKLALPGLNETGAKETKDYLKAAIEALIFASGDPLEPAKIASILGIDQKSTVLLLTEIIESMQKQERGIIIGEVAGGYQMYTKPEFAEIVAKIAEKRDTKLSAAALETLAIIAFKQPVTRLEIENIRGVKVDGIVNMLTEKLLIKESGRKETLGRPILYSTTEEFLLCFGLKSLDDLPPLADFLKENFRDSGETV